MATKEGGSLYYWVGGAIRVCRKIKGMSQQQLADSIGMTRTALVQLENGNRYIRLHDVADIAKAMGEEPMWVMKGIWSVIPKPNEYRGTDADKVADNGESC